MKHQHNLMTRGNRKVGEDVLLFSIPAGGECCPGATEACKSVCYALRPHTWMSVRWQNGKYVANYEASRQPDFVGRIIAELQQAKARAERNKKPQLCRIHDSGDFYDAKYVRKWIEIAKASPTFTFWVYTRSWRIPDIYPALLDLAAQPNVQMWFSHDADTGDPPKVEGIDWSWMQVDEELPSTPSDLIFREKKKGRKPARRIGGTRVCPQENGYVVDQNLTCQNCTICFRNKANPLSLQLASKTRTLKGELAMNENDNITSIRREVADQNAKPEKSGPKRGPRNSEWKVPKKVDDASNEFPNDSWSRHKLETFLLKGEGDVVDWRRKTVQRQFEIGAAWHFLKHKLKADGEGIREWQRKHNLNHQTMNEREQLYVAYKDDPQGLSTHVTKVAALESKNLIASPRKKKTAVDVEETLANIEHRVKQQQENAQKRHENEADGTGTADEQWTCEMVSVEFVSLIARLHALSDHIRQCVASTPACANRIRAYLLRCVEESDGMLELLSATERQSEVTNANHV